MSNRLIESFLKKINSFSADNNLFSSGKTYIVALSGGADSVALLLSLKSLGVSIVAAHCNFRLRDEESDRDENFCIQLCKKYDINLHRVHFDTRTYASLHKVSIEMAARDLRYGWFEQLRRDISAEAICTGHHRDDQAETVIMNLMRGTGLSGLKGMMPKSGNIIRPLLCVGRDEIESFLKYSGQDYVIDSTNLTDDVVRNKVRLNIIPQMEAINPAVKHNIAATARYVAQAQKIIDSNEEKYEKYVFDDNKIDLVKLAQLPSPEYTLYKILSQYGFTPLTTEQIYYSLDGGSGRLWESQSHEALIDRNNIIIEQKRNYKHKNFTIPETGIYVIDEDTRLSFSIEDISNGYEIIKSKDYACLDGEKAKFPLVVRHVETGDRFCPFGMNGSKLISDYLTDQKATLFQKRKQRIVVDATGQILWVVGERPNNRFRITKNTKRALIIQLLNK